MVNFLVLLAIAMASAVIVWVYWRWVAGRQFMFSAPNGFFLLQLPYLIGTFGAVNPENSQDMIWLLAQVGSLALFTAGAILANSMRHFHPAQEIPAFRARPVYYDLDRGWKVLFVAASGIVSMVVGVYYSMAVGYNVFTYNLKQFITTGAINSEEYSTMRTSISVDKYVAAGYSAQFVAIILPLVIAFLWFRWWQNHRALNLFSLVVLSLGDLYFLTLTGGRGWMIFAIGGFVALLFVGPFPRVGKRMRTWGIVAMCIVVVFYGASTTLMGRTAVEGQHNLATGVLLDFYDRIVGWEARGQMLLMQYFLSVPSVWGAEWWASLRDLLPQTRQARGFGSELHAMLYKGDRSGSLGLTFAGSVIYNWGLLGLAFLSLAVGWLLERLNIAYVRGPRLLSRLLVLFFAGFSLARLRDPYSLLLEGFVTLGLCYWILKLDGDAGACPLMRHSAARPAAKLNRVPTRTGHFRPFAPTRVDLRPVLRSRPPEQA
ncbi:MAG TPA: hypothetical protein VFA04_01335 [Bryobacteraceae bacterium]|nr:hypothetical protein [Bryobacteraceae bacterium]